MAVGGEMNIMDAKFFNLNNFHSMVSASLILHLPRQLALPAHVLPNNPIGKLHHVKYSCDIQVSPDFCIICINFTNIMATIYCILSLICRQDHREQHWSKI